MSPSPSTSPEDDALRFIRDVRASFEADVKDLATEKDKLDQLVSIRSFAFKLIKDATTQSPETHRSTREGLNLLRHMFCTTAQALDHTDSFQYKLISLLQWTKEYDTIYKSIHHLHGAASWDAYGFDGFLLEFWKTLLRNGEAFKTCNLARFSSKTLALGICPRVESVALWFLREAFETEKGPERLATIPAASIWLDECNFSIMALSLGHRRQPDMSRTRPQAPGILAVAAGIEDAGFSVRRWLFWRSQLQEVSRADDALVSKTARKAFVNMISCGRIMDQEVPGEAKFAEKLQKATWEELIRCGKKSVDGDEIDIDVDWVN